MLNKINFKRACLKSVNADIKISGTWKSNYLSRLHNCTFYD